MAFPSIDETHPATGTLAKKSIFRSNFSAIKTLINQLFQQTGGVKYLTSDTNQSIDTSDEDNYVMYRTGANWTAERTITFTGTPQDGAIIEISNNSGQDIFLTNGTGSPMDIPLDPFRIQKGTGVTLQTDNNNKLIKTKRWWETSSSRITPFGGSEGDFLGKLSDDDSDFDWLGIDDLDTGTIDGAADYLMFVDATDGKHKKVLANDLPGGGGGVSELSDLSDVDTSTATNRNVLVADGTDWESRALVEADISDLGSYQTQDDFLDDIAALTDPGADRILFWDDSAGAMAFLTIGTNLSVTGTTLNASGGGGVVDLDDLSDVNTSTPTNRNVLVADGVDWESRALVEADISDLGSYQTQDDFLDDIAALTDPGADRILFWDDSAGAMAFLTIGNNLSVTGTTLNASGGGGVVDLDDLSDVDTSTPTNRNVLVADGTDWESRALVEADISDLGDYLLKSGGVMSGVLDMNGNEITLDADGDSGIYENADDEIRLKVGGSDRIQFSDNRMLFLGGMDFDLDQNVIWGYHTKKYNDQTGAETLSRANFESGSTIIFDDSSGATYTVPSRIGTTSDESEQLVIRNRGTASITLSASGVTIKGNTTIAQDESATLEWESDGTTEYVWVDGGS